MDDRLYSIDDLRKVKGIGKKTIERIKGQFDDSEYISKYDETIHIKPNSLVYGDMLEVMNGIPDKSVDMILTDLPYGTTACSWDSVIDFDKLWKQYNRVIKDDGAIVLFGSEPFSTKLRNSNIDNYKYDWTWDKQIPSGMGYARFRPMQQTEDICVFEKMGRKTIYNAQKTKREKPIKSGGVKRSDSAPHTMTKPLNKTYDYKNPVTLLSYKKIRRGSLHPTQKPLALIEYLIKTYTNENDLVLDSTMGSGTTCLGAKNLNRRYIGIELDKEYYEIAKERVLGI